MDRPLRGIALCMAATVCFSTSDALAKYLTGALPPVEIAWVRYVVFTLMAVGPMAQRQHASPYARAPWLQIMRGVGVVGSAVLFIAALHALPIAEATTISFASPLLTTILSVVLLREAVGLNRWLVVLVGFAGVLVVVRPASAQFHPQALLVILSSVFWSIALIVTRRIAAADRSTTTVLWTAVSGLVVLTALLPFWFVVPTVGSLSMAFAIGIAASSGQVLTILAYREAPASVLAPVSYAQLLWSACYGMLIFGAVPDTYTCVGAAVIAASGLYNVQAERMRLRRLKALATA